MEKISPLKLNVCIPVFNDWDAVAILLIRLNETFSQLCQTASLLLVDDGSTEPFPSDFPRALSHITQIEILELRRNLGHQRAIAVGLCHIYERNDAEAILVMDGDGEDIPESVGQLIKAFEHHQRTCVVFAQRARRTEGIGFKIGYAAFKIVHRLLTGISIQVGNFSIIPHRLLGRLVGVSELWNHYAASIFKARIPYQLTPIDRGRRILGQSKMNISALALHELSAISVFAEVIGIKLLWSISLFALFSFLGLAGVIGFRLFAEKGIPAWTTPAAGLLLLLLLQSFAISLIFIFAILQRRNSADFIPLRDYRHFIYDVHVLEAL